MFSLPTSSMSGVGNLRSEWTFNMARIRSFFTQITVEHNVQNENP